MDRTDGAEFLNNYRAKPLVHIGLEALPPPSNGRNYQMIATLGVNTIVHFVGGVRLSKLFVTCVRDFNTNTH